MKREIYILKITKQDDTWFERWCWEGRTKGIYKVLYSIDTYSPDVFLFLNTSSNQIEDGKSSLINDNVKIEVQLTSA